MSRALSLNLAIALATTPSSVPQYLKDNLQQIFRTFLDFKLLLAPSLVVIGAQQYKSTCKKLLKVWFFNIYQAKIDIECYNFFELYKNNLATAQAMG